MCEQIPVKKVRVMFSNVCVRWRLKSLPEASWGFRILCVLRLGAPGTWLLTEQSALGQFSIQKSPEKLQNVSDSGAFVRVHLMGWQRLQSWRQLVQRTALPTAWLCPVSVLFPSSPSNAAKMLTKPRNLF